MTDSQMITVSLQREECLNKLKQIAGNQSFSTKGPGKSVRITFTRFQSEEIDQGNLRIKLNGRCSSYREIGILYIQIIGVVEKIGSSIQLRYHIIPGFPTSVFEWVFGLVWNLIIILAGITLIISASEPNATERMFRYAFLPIIYGIYGIRLSIRYQRIKIAISEIIFNLCCR